MKNNPIYYRLVASMEGCRLSIDRELCGDMVADYDRRISSIKAKCSQLAHYALPLSIELERKGDFLLSCVSPAAALKAYLEGVNVALAGAKEFPGHSNRSRRFMERVVELRRKCAMCATADPHLLEVLQRNSVRSA